MKSSMQLFCEQSTWPEPFRSRGKQVMQTWNENCLSNKSQRKVFNRTARLALHAIEQEMIATKNGKAIVEIQDEWPRIVDLRP